MGNFMSKLISPRSGFSKLPLELRLQIWEHVAKDWVFEHLDYIAMWTVHGQRIFLVYIDTDSRYPKDPNGNTIFNAGYVMDFPSLLFVSREARGVMYDALLSFRYTTGSENHQQVPRGDNVQMFLKDSASQPNRWASPQIFGWRIQDFRYPDLSNRVQKEKDRLTQLAKELREVEHGVKVDPENAPEGYVRLPLFGGGTKTVVDEEGRRQIIRLYPKCNKGPGCKIEERVILRE